MKKFPLIASLVLSAAIIFFAISSLNKDKGQEVKAENTSTVTMEGNTQIIGVKATSGGYFPGTITAKANVPTVLRIDSENAYGCERSFRIPKLNITEILPQDGPTDIDLGTPDAGESILGSCSMGMYTFTIKFN